MRFVRLSAENEEALAGIGIGALTSSQVRVFDGFSSINFACFCTKPFARLASSDRSQGSLTSSLT